MATWTAEVDWDKNGVYTDESSRLAGFIIRRGRRGSVANEGYEFCDVGSMSLKMHNFDGRYNFFNSSGALYGYLLPNRPTRLKVTIGSATYYLFSGLINDIRPQSESKNVYLEAVDGIDWLKRRKGDNIAVQTDYSVTNAITSLLVNADWPYADTSGWIFPTEIGIDSYLGSSLVDDNGDYIPYWWGDPKKTVWEQITDIAGAFAGNPYVAADGTFSYQARQYGGSSVLTLEDSDVQRTTELQQPWYEIRNEIQITARPRVLTSAGVEIWRLYDTPSIEAGASITLWAEYQYNNEFAPAASVTTPASTTDYTANTQSDGGGTDKTAQVGVVMTTYATQAKLVLTNNDSARIYITLFKLRGQLYIAPNKTTMTASDSTSQTAYNKTALTVDSIWMQKTGAAQDHANYAETLFANPRRVAWVKLFGVDPAQFQVDLFSQVTLNSTVLEATGDYWVTYIEHDCQGPPNVMTTWRLEPTAQEIGGFWTFSTNLGQTSILGW